MTDTNPQQADEVDADTVAQRATQVITSMGADIRALTSQRDRYRTAWCNARERAQAHGEGILRVVGDREQYQEWLRQTETAAEAQRLALSQALGLGTGAPWDAIRDRAAELAAASAPVSPVPADRAALRDRIAEALRPGSRDRSGQYPEGLLRDVAAVLAVLPEPTNRAALLVDEAALIERHCPDHGPQDQDGAWMDCHCPVAEGMRKRASGPGGVAGETQPEPAFAPGMPCEHGCRAAADELTRELQQAEAQAEDPARIDRLRPEFTDHASVESIDAQLRRARSQERRWHIRTEWLIGLRQARVEQKANGEWPAAVSQPDEGPTP